MFNQIDIQLPTLRVEHTLVKSLLKCLHILFLHTQVSKLSHPRAHEK